MKRRLLLGLISAALTLALTGTATAQVIAATWGVSTTYVSNNVTIEPAPTGSGTEFTVTQALDLANPWLAATTSHPAIYGGLYHRATFNQSVTPNWAPVFIQNNLSLSGQPTADAIRVQSIYSVTTPYTSDTQNVVVLFQTDTSALQPGQYYTFGSDSELRWRRNFGTTANPTVRWLVVSNNSTFYVGPSVSTGTGEVVFDNPDEVNWAAWSPSSNLSLGTLNFNVLGSSITQITHVGFVANRYTTTSGTRVPVLDTLAYSASLQVIPEPTTTAMLFAGAALLFRRLRLRMA